MKISKNIPLRCSPLLLSVLISANVSASDPFSACPTEAFVIQKQSNTPKTYGVNLATGSYVVLSSDMGTGNGYNGVGFNYHDNYLYGWDYASGSLGRAGNDYQIVSLSVNKDSAAATAGNFYVGDVAISENVWYGYRKGKGLFKIPLDNPASYNMTLVPGSKDNATYNITDLAFHPTDGYMYSISNGSTGKLLRIDPTTAEATNLGTVITSTSGNFIFGAQFFDPDGNLYVSNNSNGNIYKVNVDSASPSAVLFAYGPSSSSNDGARCALAEVVVGDTVDFGDAPDTYGTLLASNGARHTISNNLYLGSSVDNESDGYASPLSDDASDNADDEDGISMPTGFELGESAILLVEATGGDGFLNAWFDWDQSGTFELEEQIILGERIDDGQNTIAIDVPSWAKPGPTWARFRLSTQRDITPTGGVGDGEVEDYPVTLTETGVTINYYPSSSTFTTLAYEDLYPDQGDFDMNDVVVQLRIIEYVKNNKVRRIGFEAQLAAMGAAYHNGFAVHLPGVSRNKIKESLISWSIDNIEQTDSPLETEQTNAVFIFAQDLSDYVTLEQGCEYLRTETGCETAFRTTWSFDIPFDSPVDESLVPAFPYDPFIFATPNTDHGLAAKNVVGANPGRQLEIHLKNQAPTDKFSTNYFGARDDASNPGASQYFQDENGMAWAIEIPVTWKHPKEKERLDNAYTEFVDFAADSTGNTNPTWYENADESLIFNN
ncbi:LruC domain-containing protein [Shewanella fidelis]|uniref:LruC domain-containing protein n=1 Tax=Shewanella fidelis TaxID=173509 RepID=A0AAW8NMZ3_9GAMM|nr:LruC domain-containing protein [Shewanella fidelis]MDR8524573.1 LruC domain-containing protein [Shewanella fidelis]MDW4812049.1 LruC domain-containing protein [Shewanella fidelis]MDW4817497.1 LruC domain-containing protein [Shewanella fidelis]MDW4821564.1 LruC domain-containing protein [Shewanella fidelis]MDW4822655.1 LruC domain-containing protein [Shewanella fidelis]